MRKSILVLMIALMMVMVFSVAVSAATVSDIIQALKDASVPDVYVLQAESYFADITVSSEDADAIIEHINNAKAIAAGETRLSMLSGEQKSAILTEITATAAILDLTVYYADQAITVKDESNNIVFAVSSADVIKQTGYDYSIILYGLIVMALAGGAVVITRKVLARSKV